MFKKVLIANRGEIALRILRTCHEMGINTVAIHSTADENAMHVRLAQESICVGPPNSTESYLNIPSIISAAEISGADAIHPGYGFLSENHRFADIVTEHGIKFIGPNHKQIELMGNKIEAKKTAKEIGISPVPGSNGPVENVSNAKKIADEIGYPIIIKAASGGGGRGMKVVESSLNLSEHFTEAKNEAKNFFGDETLYVEKYLHNPRHIEIQILCDGKGNSVFLGERDCSIQRRHQKVIEESPSPVLLPELITALGLSVAKSMISFGYEGAGTVEFLFSEGKFYFIEMNTRIQVEHSVTEEITGIDLIREQIKIAAQEKLSFDQEDINFNGHAIECRIMAENPFTFIPNSGIISSYHPPGGPGIRVDSALYTGYKIPPYYDNLISKLIVKSETREQCMMKLNQALTEYVIDGIETNLSLHKKLIKHKDFINGDYHINWLENFISDGWE
tara:strand:+ start:1165 stop:2511 length:1347 start_codon:yes stop_codon:yes gene_type:complete